MLKWVCGPKVILQLFKGLYNGLTKVFSLCTSDIFFCRNIINSSTQRVVNPVCSYTQNFNSHLPSMPHASCSFTHRDHVDCVYDGKKSPIIIFFSSFCEQVVTFCGHVVVAVVMVGNIVKIGICLRRLYTNQCLVVQKLLQPMYIVANSFYNQQCLKKFCSKKEKRANCASVADKNLLQATITHLTFQYLWTFSQHIVW